MNDLQTERVKKNFNCFLKKGKLFKDLERDYNLTLKRFFLNKTISFLPQFN